MAPVAATQHPSAPRENCSPERDPLEGVVVVLCTPSGALPVRLERAIGEGGIGVVYAGTVVGGGGGALDGGDPHTPAGGALDGGDPHTPAGGALDGGDPHTPAGGALDGGDPHTPAGGALAVKVLHARHAGDAGIRRRFELEAEHAQRLHHPNVITALGHGRLADGRPFFAMERLEGATLGALVRERGPLPVTEGLRLADQILAGLEALHDAGLVHRDLSPDNVFVSAHRDGARAVILDLGFAQPPGVDAGDGLTPDSPGSLVGTLTFMAPEQATRGRAITARSDLFAAAVLLYYAFSGKLPFRGHDDLDVLVSVVRAAPVPLRRERRDAPPALDQALGRALAKHPDGRFASAREMRAALARIRLPSDATPKPRTTAPRALVARRVPSAMVASRLSA